MRIRHYGALDDADCWFIDRIRDEKKFNGIEELKGQLALDAVAVKGIL